MSIFEKLTHQMTEIIESGVSLALHNKNPEVEPVHLVWALLTNSGSVLNQALNRMNIDKAPIELEAKSVADRLPKVSTVTKESIKQKYASLGWIFGVENDAEKVIEAADKWLESLGMKVSLSSLGVTEDKLQAIEDYAIGDPCYPLNPKVAEKGDVVKILKNIM